MAAARCIHLYHGDGKGKTTAAMGLALRAAGQHWRVGIAQFLKNGSSGECAVLAAIPGIALFPTPSVIPFTFSMSPAERKEAQAFYRQLMQQCWEQAEQLDLLILDEVLDAVHTDILPEDRLLDFLDHKPSALEVVLTGRQPSPDVCARAQYITYMRKDRHPFDDGQSARRGIEW